MCTKETDFGSGKSVIKTSSISKNDVVVDFVLLLATSDIPVKPNLLTFNLSLVMFMKLRLKMFKNYLIEKLFFTTVYRIAFYKLKVST